jgi:hypothetical protein
MARILRWKGTVARSILALALITVGFQAMAQAVRNARITYTCQSLSLEKVMEHLSERTGLYFVYSADKIGASAPVTLRVKDKSLEEVLSDIGKQLNLSFKVYDRHITIKSSPVLLASLPVVPLKKTNEEVPSPQPVYTAAATSQPIEISELVTQRAMDMPSWQDKNEKYMAPLRPYLDAARLKRVPLKYIKSAARKINSGWFVAGGTLVNDYSLGLEVQAGFRSAYVVFSPSWMPGKQLHEAWGIGSSIPLSDKLAINPVYTYASLKTSEVITPSITNSFAYQSNSTGYHHQLKLMVQYALNRNINFRAGATFNISQSNFKYQPIDNKPVFNSKMIDPYHADYTDIKKPFVEPHTLKTIPDVTVNRFWIGWEASVSYRINFFRKK